MPEAPWSWQARRNRWPRTPALIRGDFSGARWPRRERTPLREGRMIREKVAGLALAGLSIAWPAGAQSGSADAQLADLQNPGTRTRISALHRLGEQGRMDAATPMAALLLDRHGEVEVGSVEW